jgi:hypothetical protein
MAKRIKWVYLTTAPDQLTAEMWRGLIQGEGLPVMIRPGDTASYLGVTAAPCRLMVPAESLEKALAFVRERLGRDSVV